MTAQQRHEAIREIARDASITDAEALRRIAEVATGDVVQHAAGIAARMGVTEFEVWQRVADLHTPKSK